MTSTLSPRSLRILPSVPFATEFGATLVRFVCLMCGPIVEVPQRDAPTARVRCAQCRGNVIVEHVSPGGGSSAPVNTGRTVGRLPTLSQRDMDRDPSERYWG